MHYDVYYKGTKQEQYQAAHKDAMEWLNKKQREVIKTLTKTYENQGIPRISAYRCLKQALSFTGIQGLPARVLAFHTVFGRLPK